MHVSRRVKRKKKYISMIILRIRDEFPIKVHIYFTTRNLECFDDHISNIFHMITLDDNFLCTLGCVLHRGRPGKLFRECLRDILQFDIRDGFHPHNDSRCLSFGSSYLLNYDPSFYRIYSLLCLHQSFFLPIVTQFYLTNTVC